MEPNDNPVGDPENTLPPVGGANPNPAEPAEVPPGSAAAGVAPVAGEVESVPAAPAATEPPAVEAPPPLLQEPAPPPVLAGDPPTLERVRNRVLVSPRAKRVGGWLIAATILTGLLQFVLSVLATRARYGSAMTPVAIGYMLGGAFLWPLFIAGLFAIGRRFRNARSVLITANVVWGLFILTHMGSISRLPSNFSSSFRPDPSGVKWTHTPTPAAPATFQATLPPDVVEPGDDGIDFSPGSDERLLQLVQGSQEERYRRVLDSYEKAIGRNPDNARLAVERVKFIDHYANSEDYPIASADEDRDKALGYVKEHFARRPEAVVYLLGHEYGDSLDEMLEEYREVERYWPAKYRAEFLLIRARQTQESFPLLSYNDARESLHLVPTVDAALLTAEAAKVNGNREDALEALASPVFGDAGAWIQKRRVELYFALDDAGTALEIYDSLKKENPAFLFGAEMAENLAKAGRLKEAREALGRQAVGDWNREKVMRGRFDFEKRHGDAGSIMEAYRNLRALGLHTDPFARERIDLALEHSGTKWAAADFFGLLSALAFFAGVALSPLCVLLPVHYWSLLRARKGKTPGSPGAPWGLRHVWLMTAVMLLLEAVVLWWWQPATVQSWFGQEVAIPGVGNATLVRMAFLGWTVIGLLLVILVARARAWHLFGTGTWRFGKAFGGGVLVMGVLKVVAFITLMLFPHLILQGIAAYQSQTLQLVLAIRDEFGVSGAIGCIAVLVPVVEEFLFRGVILQGLSRHIPFGWANVIQAALFAGLHEQTWMFPALFAFAIGCGILARRSGGLGAPLIAHAANNLFVVLKLAF